MNEYKQKELELFHTYKAGNVEAKKELLTSLQPLINTQVTKFATSGLPITAIRLEGHRLASGAIDTYDPSKSQLNTHVVNNLKKLSRFVINYQNVGHIPEPRAMMIGKYNTIYSNLESDKGREPTAAEIADAMQIPLNEVNRLQTELRSDLSSTMIDEDSDDASGFYQYIMPGTMDPKLKEAIEFIYFDADNTDKKILEMTVGLYGSQKYAAKDIATKLKLTQQDLKKRKVALAIKIQELA